MKIQDVKYIAKKNGVVVGKMNKIGLVRAIQITEGNNTCFATGAVQTCSQMNCLWRADCK